MCWGKVCLIGPFFFISFGGHALGPTILLCVLPTCLWQYVKIILCREICIMHWKKQTKIQAKKILNLKLFSINVLFVKTLGHNTTLSILAALRCACLLPQLVLRSGFTVQVSVRHCFVVSSSYPTGRASVGFQKCPWNSCNREENNTRPLVKEASVKWWIHYFERHTHHVMTRLTDIVWAIRTNNIWKV